MARAAEDLALGARLLGTADGSGAAGWWLQAAPRHDTLAAFRVAVLPLPDDVPVHEEVAAAFEAFLADLHRVGVVVRTLPLSFISLLYRPQAGQAAVHELERQRSRHLLADLFKTWDVLLTPATPAPAPRQGEVPLAWDLHSPAFTRIGAISGHPATVFPIGLTRHWLPLAVQAIGPFLEDRTPMQFAALAQAEFGGYHRPPSYSHAG